MNVYSVVLFDQFAPAQEIRIALWARNWQSAMKRGQGLGRVIRVEPLKIMPEYEQTSASARLRFDA